MNTKRTKNHIPWYAWLVLWPFWLVWQVLKKLWDIVSTVGGFLLQILTLPWRLGRQAPDGRAYEYSTAGWMVHHGFHHISITPGSGDYGVDILARRGVHRYAVQCKYYNYPVGIKAVQEVAAGMAHYDCRRAAVITNSTFTPAARTLADEHDILLLENIPYRRRWEYRGERFPSQE